jgi:hypothetical protein
MNGQIADAVIEALTVLKDTLRPGEFVTVEVNELRRDGESDEAAWMERRIVLRAE